MSIAQIVVVLSAVLLTVLIVWYFWLAPKEHALAKVNEAGAQEVRIIVKGGYTPDIIVVQKGRPVRLIFMRQESSTCSEKVLFPDFNQSAILPEGEQVVLEFTPERAGEYGFQCQMGMLRGKLIVE